MAISKYWLDLGKTEADKRPGETFEWNNSGLRCAECCNKDRCSGEDCDLFYRPKCPFCLGTGVSATGLVKSQPFERLDPM